MVLVQMQCVIQILQIVNSHLTEMQHTHAQMPFIVITAHVSDVHLLLEGEELFVSGPQLLSLLQELQNILFLPGKLRFIVRHTATLKFGSILFWCQETQLLEERWDTNREDPT